jgi:ABC-type cobalamin transport system ATPase subunit
MPSSKPRQPVPGTTIFDGEKARKGYALNKMCYLFNDAANRRAFVEDEDAYCAKYGLNAQQREAGARPALIGPNGAGKTPVIILLTGDLRTRRSRLAKPSCRLEGPARS